MKNFKHKSCDKSFTCRFMTMLYMLNLDKGGFVLVENIQEGKKAPDFILEASSGEKIALNDYLGKNIVLYFYPKDNTPG